MAIHLTLRLAFFPLRSGDRSWAKMLAPSTNFRSPNRSLPEANVMGRKLQGYRRWPAVRVDELPPGSKKIIEIDGRSIGLFNVKGNYRAVLNVCPHELAP